MRLLTAILLLLSMVACAPGYNDPTLAPIDFVPLSVDPICETEAKRSAGNYEKGEIIVKFVSGISIGQVRAFLREQSVSITATEEQKISQQIPVVIQVEEGTEINKACSFINHHFVESADLNLIMYAL